MFVIIIDVFDFLALLINSIDFFDVLIKHYIYLDLNYSSE